MTRRPKLLVVGIDGARADVVAGIAADPRSALGALVRQGASTFSATTAHITVSGPAWASAVTGSWVAKHGVVDNDFDTHRLDEFPHFLVRLRQFAPSYRTASIVHWAPLNAQLLRPADVDVCEAHPADATVCARAAALLRHDAALDALFVHLDEVDAWGHRAIYSRWSPLYVRAARRADRMLGTLLDAIAARPTRAAEEWLVIATSDHGGRWFGHERAGESARRVPLVIGGDAATCGALPPSTAIVDVATTCLHHLGLGIDPSWRLDGVVRGHRRPPRVDRAPGDVVFVAAT